jgi:hypothetical protein
MSATGINNATKVFKSKQTPVVCLQYNVPQYPSIGALLAPSTDTTLPLYSAGRLLATYGVDAPDPALVGKSVNWDPASAVVSQQTPTHILSDEFVHDLVGIDITNNDTLTATANRVRITPLGIGLGLYLNAITSGNTAAIVTAFNAAFRTIVLGNSSNTLETTQVISIQEVL